MSEISAAEKLETTRPACSCLLAPRMVHVALYGHELGTVSEYRCPACRARVWVRNWDGKPATGKDGTLRT